MHLYIKVEDGNTVGNPVLRDNLMAAFKKIPENYQPFVRIEKPLPRSLDVYETLVSDDPTYEYDAELQAYKDVWATRDMTDAEKIEKQNRVKELWNLRPNRENFSSWTFDTDLCEYVPPVPKPTDGIYFWDGSSNSWIAVTPE